jgi:hypothetical protein
MEHKVKSLRPFIGAKDFEVSRGFYRDLGFEETVIAHNMSVFKTGSFAFYLQDFYVKDRQHDAFFRGGRCFPLLG